MRQSLKPKPFLDSSRLDWQFQAFAWLLRHTGGYSKFLETTLVLPTEDISRSWLERPRCGGRVVSSRARPRRHGRLAVHRSSRSARSRASRTDESGASRSSRMCAKGSSRSRWWQISRVTSRATSSRPSTNRRPAARRSATPRWSWQRCSWAWHFHGELRQVHAARQPLNEGELVHALALFCLLQRTPPEAADEHLNPHLRKYLRLAMWDLAQHEARFRALRGAAAEDPAERTLPVHGR
jgi:hypothetical protein